MTFEIVAAMFASFVLGYVIGIAHEQGIQRRRRRSREEE